MPFEDWFETFWQTYPKDLLYNTKGAKEGPYREKLKKRTPEQLADILDALREQIRYRRKAKQAGEDRTKWQFPMVSVWVNQCRWSEEIPSHKDLHEKTQEKFCKCGKPAFHTRLGLCPSCYRDSTPTPYKELQSKNWKEKGLSALKTPEEHRAYLKKHYGVDV